MNIDVNTLATAERIAIAEHNSRVAAEVRRISAAAHQRAQSAPAAGKVATMTAAEARDDAAKANAAEATTREQFAAEYRRDVKLQQEFSTEAEYVAYKKAEAAGRVRIVSNRIVRPGK